MKSELKIASSGSNIIPIKYFAFPLQELGYVKKELIEARANKSASDDKLSHVQDKIETMQNNINSLSDEGKIFNLFLKIPIHNCNL